MDIGTEELRAVEAITRELSSCDEWAPATSSGEEDKSKPSSHLSEPNWPSALGGTIRHDDVA
jgi:hypothetical protein